MFSPNKYVYTSEVDKAKKVMKEYRWWSKHKDITFVLPYKRSDTFVSKVSNKLRNTCKSTNTFEPNCVYPFPHTGLYKAKIPEKIELDYDFGYLIGAYCAEGCITKTQISIANNDLNYFSPIQKLCKKYNITTKIYKNINKNQEGWTSQDIRIYSTMLTKIILKFAGKLSHNKFVSDKIVFSNKLCLNGFLDAYIGGDGTINKRDRCIIISSVSKQLLEDVSQILNIFGIYSYILMPKKVLTNNRGSKNIKQLYCLTIRNKQAQNLANILNMKIEKKQKLLDLIKNYNFRHKLCKNEEVVPNIIGNKIKYEARNNRYTDIYFDKIINIEEVKNSTEFVYDLTVEDTRTFNIYNRLCLNDTFHFAGVGSKSKVTSSGVPRLKQILSNSQIKKGSMTIYVNQKYVKYNNNVKSMTNQKKKIIDLKNNLEIIYFKDIIKSSTISTNFINTRDSMLEIYKKFHEINVSEEEYPWIIQFEFNEEVLLEKNIDLFDIEFICNQYFKDDDSIINVFSDNNSEKLIANFYVKCQDKYNLIALIENNISNIIIKGIKGINNIYVDDGIEIKKMKFINDKTSQWILYSSGNNLLDILCLPEIDSTKTISDDLREIYKVLGIEAVRNIIISELNKVLNEGVNYQHIALLADNMTCRGQTKSLDRHGIPNKCDDIDPITKASFEEMNEQLVKATVFAQTDSMGGVSANIMLGQGCPYGTGQFTISLDLDKLEDIDMVDTLDLGFEEF